MSALVRLVGTAYYFYVTVDLFGTLGLFLRLRLASISQTFWQSLKRGFQMTSLVITCI
jgi:hypothetical protein